MISKRYSSLDLFRGVCGYGVAITHFYAYLYENVLAEYFSLLFVEWFFVLSGFVLYPQLVKVLNDKRHLSTFYVRRWVRTLPLYGLALCCAAMMTGHLLSGDFFLYLIFIQKFFPAILNNDFYPVAWSLSVEEHFYLAFPLFLVLAGKSAFIRKVLLLFLGMTVLKIFFSTSVDLNFYRTGTLFRLDAILLGFIGAHYKDSIVLHGKWVILAVVLLFAIFIGVRESIFLGHVSVIGKVLFVLLLQMMSFSLLFAFILADKAIRGRHLRSFCALLANQTYSIYLFHLMFLYIIKASFLEVDGIFLYYLAALFVVSYGIFEYFEKPLLGTRPKYK